MRPCTTAMPMENPLQCMAGIRDTERERETESQRDREVSSKKYHEVVTTGFEPRDTHYGLCLPPLLLHCYFPGSLPIFRLCEVSEPCSTPFSPLHAGISFSIPKLWSSVPSSCPLAAAQWTPYLLGNLVLISSDRNLCRWFATWYGKAIDLKCYGC